jgi:hypothetical protein
MKRITLAAALLAAFPASAMDPADFLVDWQSMIGERVILRSVTVYGATPDYATAILEGQFFTVVQPWADRDDLRYLFRNCAKIIPDKAQCTMDVEGEVSNGFTGGLALKDVDFALPKP